jgi:FkbM family methyltransferase
VIRKLHAFSVRFGLIQGIRNFVAAHARRALVSVTVPGGRSPIWLRRGSTDLAVFEEVFVRQAYFIEKMAKIRPSVIIDAGANIGITSIFFALAYPNARIFSIEPEERNYELLKRNTAAYPQITSIHAALWNRDQDVEIEDPGRGAWAFQVKEAGAGPRNMVVPGVSVLGLCRRFGIDQIDIFKIDIEGAERELFSSEPGGWLAITEHLILELHDRLADGCSRSLYRAITQYQFSQEIKEKNVFLELPRRPAAHVLSLGESAGVETARP